MKITQKMIQDDIRQTLDFLKNKEIEIPSSWMCMKLGLTFFLGMVIWQIYVASSYLVIQGKINEMYAYGSIGFTSFLGFIVFITSTSLLGRYYSLPKELRENGLIVNLYRKKLANFMFSWGGVNIVAGIITKTMVINPLFGSSVIQLLSLIVFTFFFTVDIGRYDLALFNSVINAWRNGEPRAR